MDFNLSQEQKMLQEAVIKFVLKEWEPNTQEIDESNKFHMWLWRRFRDLSWCGMMIPKEYGGAGMTLLDTCIALESMVHAGGDVGTTLGLATHLSIGSIPLLVCGNDEQKKRFLPKIATGEWQSCFMLTEPNVGSDATGVETVAVREGDGYILNGTKTFITNAPTADVGMIMASTDRSKGAKGLTAFMIDMRAPGVKVGPSFDKIGPRGSEQAEVYLENVKVPLKDRILEEGDGFIKVGVQNLEYERSCLTSIWTGLLGYNIDLAVKYAKERKQFGNPIIQYAQIRDRIAQMQIEYDICKLLMYRAASKKDAGEQAPLEATEFKVYVGQCGMRSAMEAMQIFGGYGLIKEYKIERSLRDAKLAQLGAGTEQVLMEIIARMVTGTRSLTI
ncbi:MAG: acyl-CoA dehydrogenase family protein [Deltaproteobacteria bacterium]|jgi:alkylation response protein AidB-like acyl-CoA dehydrogenase|nr:acyl-CoA dehydrogenase family protein [Deltaproteobacteria bacterium]